MQVLVAIQNMFWLVNYLTWCWSMDGKNWAETFMLTTNVRCFCDFYVISFIHMSHWCAKTRGSEYMFAVLKHAFITPWKICILQPSALCGCTYRWTILTLTTWLTPRNLKRFIWIQTGGKTQMSALTSLGRTILASRTFTVVIKMQQCLFLQLRHHDFSVMHVHLLSDKYY